MMKNTERTQDELRRAEVGDYLVPDGWKVGEKLEEDDGYSDSSFPGCQFRLPVSAPVKMSLAVNLKVTGRTLWFDRTSGRDKIRVRIEFVGDGEESTFHGGWLYPKVDWTEVL
jgi:hypothetical protein